MGNAIRSVAVAAAVIGLVTGCTSTSDSGSKGAPTSAPATTASAAATSPAQLQALVPTPAGTAQTYGPDAVANNGIHLGFKVTGAPTDVVTAYKAALEGKGWTVTTIVSSGGGPGGAGRHLHRDPWRQLRRVRWWRVRHRDVSQRVRLARQAGPAELQPRRPEVASLGDHEARASVRQLFHSHTIGYAINRVRNHLG